MIDALMMRRITQIVNKNCAWFSPEWREDITQDIILKILSGDKRTNIKWILRDVLLELGWSKRRGGVRGAMALGCLRSSDELGEVEEIRNETMDGLRLLDLEKIIKRTKPHHQVYLKALARGFTSKEIATEFEFTESRASMLCNQAINYARRKSL